MCTSLRTRTRTRTRTHTSTCTQKLQDQQVRDKCMHSNNTFAKTVHNFASDLALALITKGFPYYSKQKLYLNLHLEFLCLFGKVMV